MKVLEINEAETELKLLKLEKYCGSRLLERKNIDSKLVEKIFEATWSKFEATAWKNNI